MFRIQEIMINLLDIHDIVAPVELDKTTPRFNVNWSILTSVMDTPFPRNLKTAGSNPLQFGDTVS